MGTLGRLVAAIGEGVFADLATLDETTLTPITGISDDPRAL